MRWGCRRNRGFATFSPRLDEYGNPVRGVEFRRQLVDRFTFHIDDSLSGGHPGCKCDSRASQHNRKERDLSELRWAISYGDRYALMVRDLILECIFDVCLADGEVNDPEISLLSNTDSEIMGQSISREELMSWMERRRIPEAEEDPSKGSGSDDPISRLERCLSEALRRLEHNGRELILESAFRVACSDGEIEERERAILQAITRALDINEGVLDLEISRFQRHLAINELRAASSGSRG